MAPTNARPSLAGHEERINTLESLRREDSAKLEMILEIVMRLDEKAKGQHTPEICPLKARMDDHEARLRVIESAKGQAEGGTRFAAWLIPILCGIGGTVLGIVLTFVMHH
jgi:hypothetical protein